MMNSTTLQISNLIWKIKKVPWGSPHLIYEGVACYGLCNPETLEIYIQGTELNKQLYKSYLIHELTHAYIFSMGFSYKMTKRFDEEDVCYFMQHHGSEILKDAEHCYKKLFTE